jgi:quinone-modifying oxidoreductase subunit QmoB
MGNKLGVYICTGCDIGDSLDIEALSKVATSEQKAEICKNHPFFCGSEGLGIIKKDIADEGVDTAVIVGCSHRVNQDVFKFENCVLERANIREQVVWTHPPNDEDTQMLAEDYIRMGCVKAKKTKEVVPFQEDINKTVMVIGGGVTGMTAALNAADAGYDAVLVEKADELGGWAAKHRKTLPMTPPYKTLEDPWYGNLVDAAKNHEKIKVLTSTEITSIAGGPGLFDVTFSNGTDPVRVGAIVVAVGWKPYDASKLDNLGYGKFKNVVSSVELEEMSAKGDITRPSDGNAPRSVLFVQCAGSRDENHLKYCSSVCCLATLKQTLYLSEQDPDIKSYVIYKDMRMPGVYENFYQAAQENEKLFLTKGEISGVSEGPDGKLIVDVDNTLLGEDIQIEADMVVLATGMVSNTKDAEILKLQYRLGAELPETDDGFADSDFICFPYETKRTGIYTAGPARQPMEMMSSMEDAAGATMKAIQCVELLTEGKAVHPRAMDTCIQEIDLKRCTQCKRCTEECPFGAYNEDEKGTPLINPTRCRRCGICLGSCPERIINFATYSVDMIGSMVKAIEVPEEFEEKPRILSFICENDAYPAVDQAGMNHLQMDPWTRFIPLRCLGSLNLIWIADALSKGIDGIILFGCKFGEDYQCHFIKGSELADYRLGKIQETLDRLMLEAERIKYVQLAIDDYHKIPEIINEFAEDLENIGPNPFKDM